MEKAIYISKIDNLKYWSEEYSRIYFGNEFCQELIPDLDEFKKVIEFCCNYDLDMSLVTCLFTDTKLKKIYEILDYVSKQGIRCEVVMNNWGMLNFIKNYNVTPVIGRLLTKQRRGPKLLDVKNILSDTMKDCIQEIRVGSVLIEFLKVIGGNRLEIDNLLQGIKLEKDNLKGINISLYIPYAYVTVTRLCLSNALNRNKNMKLGVFPCRKECLKQAFILKHQSMPTQLLLRGNAIFFKNEKIPVNTYGIDRVIYQPELPF